MFFSLYFYCDLYYNYIFITATVMVMNLGSRVAEASCKGTELLHIELLSTNSTTRVPGQLMVSRQNLRTIFHLCEGVGSCRFPVLEEGDGKGELLSFFCSQVTQPGRSFC